ncbi:MAG: hypothetical protein LBN71_10050, partial [Tannerella sp.]|nr:hypothetical protein [Tannerella sp.]
AVRPEGDASFVDGGKFKDPGVYYKNPQLINEYAYLWLNRNGSPTRLTDHIYDMLWDGSRLTSGERMYIYARHLAMLTEYWRAHRKVAGVLHFCGLAYSRPEEPRGYTSDNFADIPNLTFEPEFYKYVKPAFSPVGLMVDVWEKDYPAEAKITVPVYVINDLKTGFEQDVVLTIWQKDRMVSTDKKTVSVKGYEVEVISFEITLPGDPGEYQLKAEIKVNDDVVFSLRDIPVRNL